MKKRIAAITSEFHIHKRTLPHWQSGGNSYFITFRSAIGELHSDALLEVKKTILDGHDKKYELLFGVVMPDHVHLLLRPIEKESGVWYNLAEIMKAIKGVSARKINLLYERHGTVWQDEYFDRMIRNEKEAGEKIEYMWNNPSKKNLVDSFEEYAFILNLRKK